MSLLSEILTPSFAVLAAVAALAGLVRGFAGFGAGLLMAPIFSLLLGPLAAVPILVLLDAVGSVQLLPGAIPLTRWRRIAALGIAAAVTIPLGGALLTSLDPELTRRVLSAIVLASAAALALGWRHRTEPSTPLLATTGAISGLLTGYGGIGGPPVILLHLSGPDAAPSSRANMISYFAVSQFLALLAFAFQGLLDPAALLRAALLTPPFLIAIRVGSRLFRSAGEAAYRRAALALLAASGIVGLLLARPAA